MRKTIDVHGFNRVELKAYLDQILNAKSNISELCVIHGYSTTILRTFVRKTYHHPKIAQVFVGLNPGETIYYLKK